MTASSKNQSIDSSQTKTNKKAGVGRPSKTGLNHQGVRERLLWCGTALLTEKGFNSLRVDEILKKEGVPKGSFYHYFDSKQAYTQAVIENYAQYFSQKLQRHLLAPENTPLTGLRAFIDDARQGMAKYFYQRGCLVGNLGQELASSHSEFRHQLENIFAAWQGHIRDCLERAIECGEIDANHDPQALAEFFWIAWEGAVLRAKLSQNAYPLERFEQYYFSLLTAPVDAQVVPQEH